MEDGNCPDSDGLIVERMEAENRQEQQRLALFVKDALSTPFLNRAYRTYVTVLVASVDAPRAARSITNEIVIEVALEGRWVWLRRKRILAHLHRASQKYRLTNVQYEVVRPVYSYLWPTVLRMRVPVDNKCHLPYIPINEAHYVESVENHRVHVYTLDKINMPQLGVRIPKHFVA